jgi:hypothetical protein
VNRSVHTRGRIDPEFDKYEMMAQAIETAEDVKRELAEQVPGMLARYLHYAEKQAVAATALLITAHPDDRAEELRCKRIIAAYVEPLHWVRTTLEAGRLAEQEWEDVRENLPDEEESD